MLRDDTQHAAFASMLPGYEAASAGCATCCLVEVLCISRSCPIVDFHNTTIGASSGRPLLAPVHRRTHASEDTGMPRHAAPVR